VQMHVATWNVRDDDMRWMYGLYRTNQHLMRTFKKTIIFC
jgi:hypothetical protein